MIKNKNILDYTNKYNEEERALKNLNDMLNMCDDKHEKRIVQEIYKFIYKHKILAVVHPLNTYGIRPFEDNSYIVIKKCNKHWVWAHGDEKDKFTADELNRGLVHKPEMRWDTIVLTPYELFEITMYKNIGKDFDKLTNKYTKEIGRAVAWKYATEIAERKLRDSANYKFIRQNSRYGYLYDNGKLDEFYEKTKELNINILEDHVAFSLYKD